MRAVTSKFFNVGLLLCFLVVLITKWDSRRDVCVCENGINRPPTVIRADNSELLDEMKAAILPPSTERNLLNDDRRHYSQAGQSEFIDEVNGQMSEGFFVECGAADGSTLSNTLFFENARNWTGLLVEPDPSLFKKLVRRRRNAYAINACLGASDKAENVTFKALHLYGAIEGSRTKQEDAIIFKNQNATGILQVRSYPLHRILQALGQSRVHYFSLDVEGAELDILKTIPFDEVQIDYMTVEYTIIGNKAASLVRLKELQTFMESTGLYEQIAILGVADKFVGHDMNNNAELGLDVVFRRKTI